MQVGVRAAPADRPAARGALRAPRSASGCAAAPASQIRPAIGRYRPAAPGRPKTDHDDLGVRRQGVRGTGQEPLRLACPDAGVQAEGRRADEDAKGQNKAINRVRIPIEHSKGWLKAYAALRCRHHGKSGRLAGSLGAITGLAGLHPLAGSPDPADTHRKGKKPGPKTSRNICQWSTGGCEQGAAGPPFQFQRAVPPHRPAGETARRRLANLALFRLGVCRFAAVQAIAQVPRGDRLHRSSFGPCARAPRWSCQTEKHLLRDRAFSSHVPIRYPAITARVNRILAR